KRELALLDPHPYGGCHGDGERTGSDRASEVQPVARRAGLEALRQRKVAVRNHALQPGGPGRGSRYVRRRGHEGGRPDVVQLGRDVGDADLSGGRRRELGVDLLILSASPLGQEGNPPHLDRRLLIEVVRAGQLVREDLSSLPGGGAIGTDRQGGGDEQEDEELFHPHHPARAGLCSRLAPRTTKPTRILGGLLFIAEVSRRARLRRAGWGRGGGGRGGVWGGGAAAIFVLAMPSAIAPPVPAPQRSLIWRPWGYEQPGCAGPGLGASHPALAGAGR